MTNPITNSSEKLALSVKGLFPRKENAETNSFCVAVAKEINDVFQDTWLKECLPKTQVGMQEHALRNYEFLWYNSQ